MEDELATGAAACVADLLDFYRRNVSIFSQAGRLGRQRAPPIRRVRLHGHRLGVDDDIRLTDRPLVRTGEDPWRGHVGRIAARRACVDPCRERRDLFLAQRKVVLVILNADGLVDEPWRHGAHLAAEAGPLFYRARPRPDLFVGDERHRRDRIRAVAGLTTALKNRRHVLGEGRRTLSLACDGARRRERNQCRRQHEQQRLHLLVPCHRTCLLEWQNSQPVGRVKPASRAPPGWTIDHRGMPAGRTPIFFGRGV